MFLLRRGNLVRYFMYSHNMSCCSILEVTSLFTVKGFLCRLVDRKRQVLLYFILCCTTVKFSQCVQTARYFFLMICDLLLAGTPRALDHHSLGRGPVAPPTSCAQILKKQRDRNYAVYSELSANFFKFFRKSSSHGAGEGRIEMLRFEVKIKFRPPTSETSGEHLGVHWRIKTKFCPHSSSVLYHR